MPLGLFSISQVGPGLGNRTLGQCGEAALVRIVWMNCHGSRRVRRLKISVVCQRKSESWWCNSVAESGSLAYERESKDATSGAGDGGRDSDFDLATDG